MLYYKSLANFSPQRYTLKSKYQRKSLFFIKLMQPVIFVISYLESILKEYIVYLAHLHIIGICIQISSGYSCKKYFSIFLARYVFGRIMLGTYIIERMYYLVTFFIVGSKPVHYYRTVNASVKLTVCRIFTCTFKAKTYIFNTEIVVFFKNRVNDGSDLIIIHVFPRSSIKQKCSFDKFYKDGLYAIRINGFPL